MWRCETILRKIDDRLSHEDDDRILVKLNLFGSCTKSSRMEWLRRERFFIRSSYLWLNDIAYTHSAGQRVVIPKLVSRQCHENIFVTCYSTDINGSCKFCVAFVLFFDKYTGFVISAVKVCVWRIIASTNPGVVNLEGSKQISHTVWSLHNVYLQLGILLILRTTVWTSRISFVNLSIYYFIFYILYYFIIIFYLQLDDIRKEKSDIIEDLDGCKTLCENKMQKQIDELHAKRKQLEDLKEKVLECRCKLPVDAAVEVKRTASLAALCKCTSEEKFSVSKLCVNIHIWNKSMSYILKTSFIHSHIFV